MANIVITTTAKKIKVAFNDIEPFVGMGVAYFSKEHFAEVRLFSGTSGVRVTLDDGSSWNVSVNGANNTLPVDSVDGVTPTDNAHLAELVSDLMDY